MDEEEERARLHDEAYEKAVRAITEGHRRWAMAEKARKARELTFMRQALKRAMADFS